MYDFLFQVTVVTVNAIVLWSWGGTLIVTHDNFVGIQYTRWIVIIQNFLMPPLLADLLLQTDPEGLAHDGHWSRHQSMTFPAQIPSLWRRRGPGGC